MSSGGLGRQLGHESATHAEIKCFQEARSIRTSTNLSQCLRVLVGDSRVVGRMGVLMLHILHMRKACICDSLDKSLALEPDMPRMYAQHGSYHLHGGVWQLVYLP